jgi:thiol-disulfide isomerase/thioredoxin
MIGHHRNRIAVLLAALTAALPPAACTAADRGPADKAPADDKAAEPVFPKELPWFNTAPLTEKDLDGKVVLIDFWCYTCVNCIRTLPYMKEWHKRYAPHGLVIIGVHAPEFEFEKNAEHIKTAVGRFELAYPVVMDQGQFVWRSFDNQFWPAKYLFADGKELFAPRGEGGAAFRLTRTMISDLAADGVPEGVIAKLEPLVGKGYPGEAAFRAALVEAVGKDGLVRAGLDILRVAGRLGGAQTRAKYHHFGEGEYAETERTIQAALRARGVTAEFPPPMKPVGELDAVENRGAVCYPVTRELYANFRGLRQGQWGQDVELGRSRLYREYEHPLKFREGQAYLKGTWQVMDEYARHPVKTAGYEDYLAIRYKAVEVNAVIHLHTGKGPVRVKVTLDGGPMPKDHAGPDVVYENGESFLEITEPRMYRIVKSRKWGYHDLALWPKDDGFAVYAFTFGSCLKPEAAEAPRE